MTNQTPLVSININNFNYGKFLNRAIESALNQTFPNIEVIVIDDGSTDNSKEIINKYSDKILPIFKGNNGQASTFNVGFSKSKGDIICFLDADDFFLSHKVEEVVNVFLKYPKIGWCFHLINLLDCHQNKYLGTTKAFLNPDLSKSSLHDFRTQIRQGKLIFYPPPTSGMCFSRTLLESILPMPQSFIKTSADRYLRYAALASTPGYFLNQVLSIQGIHGNNAATMRNDQQRLNHNDILTAYFIRHDFPELAKFSNRVFARGWSAYMKSNQQPEYQNFIDKYFAESSMLEKMEILIFLLYHSRPWKSIDFYQDVLKH